MSEYVQFDASFLEGPLKTFFLLVITILFALVKELADRSDYPLDSSEVILKDIDPVFDFVIVGAGTAGCVLANRLAQNKNWTILLLEAGDYPLASTEVPYFFSALRNTEQDWQFQVDPKKNICQSMTRCTISRGKVLGGTTTINNMQYSRAISSDFDTLNFESWKSSTTDQVYEYLEDEELTLVPSDDELPIKTLLEDGYRSINYRKIPRYTFVGYEEERLLIKNGQRQNNAKIFLNPIKEYENFFLVTKAFVYELESNNPIDKKIIQVNVNINGFLKNIRVRKEVIVTTGAINTAKLLLASGIGPKSYLNKLKLPINADLPVGQNLKVRISVPVFIGLNVSINEEKANHIESMYYYLKNRTGYFKNTGVNNFVCYLNTKTRHFPLPAVSNHHYYFEHEEQLLKYYLDSMGYQSKVIKSFMEVMKGLALLVIEVTLIKPESAGEVLLNGTYYKNKPTIYGNFFSDQTNSDHDNLMNGICQVIQMVKSEEFQKLEAVILKIDIPNCRNFKFGTERYISCYIKNMGHPNFDVAGTTQMGPECDQLSVVNEFLEVKKIRGLRVVDAGVMPNLLYTSLEGSITMMAERAAEFVKEKWIKDYTSKYPIQEQQEQSETCTD